MNFRGADRTCRHGSNKTGADADHLARRVGAALAAPFALSSVVVTTTVSVGVVFTSDGDHDPGDLLHAADTAMYEVKRRSRADADVLRVDEDGTADEPVATRPEPGAPPAIHGVAGPDR